MPSYSGCVSKMGTSLNPSDEANYRMRLRDGYVHHSIELNQYIGKKIRIKWTGEIHCTECGVLTQKSYGQGHCGDCFKTLAQCDMCIVKPETCHYDKGTCRGENWAQTHCFRPHYVYLANSSGVKVGITRETQIPTRWIDQGAIEAMILFEVPDRKTAGEIETQLAQRVTDRTNWRRMLKNEVEFVDFAELRQQFSQLIKDKRAKFIDDAKLQKINYPVQHYPSKVKSLGLEKTPEVEGKLNGIKGQYLLLDCGEFNIRKHTGFKVEFEILEG